MTNEQSPKEPDFFQKLVRKHLDHVFNFARLYVHNKEDAEDIVQESFFKAWKHIGRFREDKEFLPWIFAIVRNTALDHIKKKRATSFSEMDSLLGAGNDEPDGAFSETLVDPLPLPPEIFERNELANELVEAMNKLHPDHQAVLIMRYQEDMSFEEIAKTLGKPMNTVKSWHHRAISRIRDILTAPKEIGART